MLRDTTGVPAVTAYHDTYIGDADAGRVWVPGAGAIEAYANGGNDVLHETMRRSLARSMICWMAEAGNDVFFGGYGDDYSIGGYGDDYRAFVTDGDMFRRRWR